MNSSVPILFGFVLMLSSLGCSKSPAQLAVKLQDGRFMQQSYVVKAGQEITVTFSHGDTTSRHNFVLATRGNEAAAAELGAAASQAKMVPDLANLVVAATKAVPADDPAELKFRAPAPGEYTFMCSIIGHAAGERGRLVVE